MNRRAFLGAAAAVAALPTDAGDVDASAVAEPAEQVRDCDVCSKETPVEMLDRTTVPEIAPLQADVCWTCQFFHRFEPADGVCNECGDALGTAYTVEIEHALGPADLPARRTFSLCGDCAEWKAHQLIHRGIKTDAVAKRRWLDLMRRETRRLNELEYYE